MSNYTSYAHLENLRKFSDFLEWDTHEDRVKASVAYRKYLEGVRLEILSVSESRYPDMAVCNTVLLDNGDLLWWASKYGGHSVLEFQHRTGNGSSSVAGKRATKNGLEHWRFIGYEDDHYGKEKWRRDDGAEELVDDMGRDTNLTALSKFDEETNYQPTKRGEIHE